MNKLMNKNTNELYGVDEVDDKLLYVHENEEKSNGRKIYYISDIHIEFKNKKGFIDFSSERYIEHVVTKMNGGEPFGDDPLFIVGDISCYLWQVDYFFKNLRMRREGVIVFVLGNHEIWAYDKIGNREFDDILAEYRKICRKYDIILLHNELCFFYDERTSNGELLLYHKKIVISEKELLLIEPELLLQYSKQAKLIIFGGVGFSGKCKRINTKGIIYNADMGLYRDVIPTLKDDIRESLRCEEVYKKISEVLYNIPIIIITHCPFDNWTNLRHNPNYIYLNGHTHSNYFEMNKEQKIFADNQVGYSSDDYDLKYFIVDATYDLFLNYKDGIYAITHEQYIEFNIGKNIQFKKKKENRQIYMIKRAGFYMFVYYNTRNKLILLNGGATKTLLHDIDYYYNNLEKYALQLSGVLEQYTSLLTSVSCNVKKIGGSGKIHGCIVDIDFYNHIYINPIDGKVVPYYAIDTNYKFVYKDIGLLLENKCPKLLHNYLKWRNVENNTSLLVPSSFELSNDEILVTDRNMYRMSRVIKKLQYLLFQNVIRDWNDNILKKFETNREEIFKEIENVQVDCEFFF